MWRVDSLLIVACGKIVDRRTTCFAIVTKFLFISACIPETAHFVALLQAAKKSFLVLIHLMHTERFTPYKANSILVDMKAASVCIIMQKVSANMKKWPMVSLLIKFQSCNNAFGENFELSFAEPG
jgi:hypothetical protein